MTKLTAKQILDKLTVSKPETMSNIEWYKCKRRFVNAGLALTPENVNELFNQFLRQ